MANRWLALGFVLSLAPGGRVCAQFGPPDVRFDFHEPFFVEVGSDANTQAFVLADMNDDRTVDLVAINRDLGTVSVALNWGDGVFGNLVAFPTGNIPTAVAVTDLDADGHADLLVVSESSDDLSILRGNGFGSFELSLASLPIAPVRLAVGNLDDDALPDLVVLGHDRVCTLRNDNRSTFTPFAPENPCIATGATGGVDIAVGDFNDDFRTDVVVLSQRRPTLGLLHGRGDGLFSAIQNFPVDEDPRDLAVGQIDFDSRDDVVVVEHGDLGSENVAVFLGTPSSFILPYRSLVEVFSTGVAFIDFDNDGYLDLAATHVAGAGLAGASGYGDGVFPELFYVKGTDNLRGAIGIATADLNGDRRADLVMLERSGDRFRIAINRSGEGPCVGDCHGDRHVTVDELVTGVEIALGTELVGKCPGFDGNKDGGVNVAELVQAVSDALTGCGFSGPL